MTEKTPRVTPPIDSLSFEEALGQLERIVAALEQGDVPLERSIEMYEHGKELRDRCEKLLQAAEARVEKIRVGADRAASGADPLDDDSVPF